MSKVKPCSEKRTRPAADGVVLFKNRNIVAALGQDRAGCHACKACTDYTDRLPARQIMSWCVAASVPIVFKQLFYGFNLTDPGFIHRAFDTAGKADPAVWKVLHKLAQQFGSLVLRLVAHEKGINVGRSNVAGHGLEIGIGYAGA